MLSSGPNTDSTTSLSNIKGVMLCTRPPANLYQSIHARDEPAERQIDKPSAFVAGSTSYENVGIPSKLRSQQLAAEVQKDRAARKQPNITTLYKQWLAKQSALRAQTAEKLEDQKRQREERMKRRADESEELRRVVQEKRQQHESQHDITQILEPHTQQPAQQQPAQPRPAISQPQASPPVSASMASSQPASSSSSSSSSVPAPAPSTQPSAADARTQQVKELIRRKVQAKKAANKPAWAMTEDQHIQEEEKTVDELLQFTQDLDFDKYMEELEEEANKPPPPEPEPEQEEEEESSAEPATGDAAAQPAQSSKPEQTGTTAAKPAAARPAASQARPGSEFRPDKGWDSSTRADRPSSSLGAGSTEQVDQLLQSNKDIQKIHSKASVKALTEHAMAATSGSAPPTAAGRTVRLADMVDHSELATVSLPGSGGAVAPPRVVVNTQGPIKPSDRGLDPSNLPYLYRNPAV